MQQTWGKPHLHMQLSINMATTNWHDNQASNLSFFRFTLVVVHLVDSGTNAKLPHENGLLT